MAVGIILEAQQAEAILQNGQADLIAVGRRSQVNPDALRITRTMIWDDQPEVRGLGTRIWLVAREAGLETMEGFATPLGVLWTNTGCWDSRVR